MELSEVDDGSRACYLRRPADPNSNQPIRIFYPRDGKSRLARLPLAPWRPSQDVHLLPLTILYCSTWLPYCLTTFLQRHKYKERTASVGTYGQGYVVTCAPNACDLRMRQLPCQYAYGQTIIVLICRQSINQPIVPIRIRSTTDQPIVPICLRSQLLSCR